MSNLSTALTQVTPPKGDLSAANMDALITAFKANHLALQSLLGVAQERQESDARCLEIAKVILLALVHVANGGKDQKQAERAIFTLSASLVPYLCQIMVDNQEAHNWPYRLGAAKALRLVNLSDKDTGQALLEALPALTEAALDPASLVQQEAVRTLTVIGIVDYNAAAALVVNMVQTKDMPLRMYALEALKQISHNTITQGLDLLCRGGVSESDKTELGKNLAQSLEMLFTAIQSTRNPNVPNALKQEKGS